MSDTAANGANLRERIAKIEANVLWGRVIGLLVIAAIGWLNVQAYETKAEIGELKAEHGERLARIETNQTAIMAVLERNSAALERNSAALDRIEVRLAE